MFNHSLLYCAFLFLLHSKQEKKKRTKRKRKPLQISYTLRAFRLNGWFGGVNLPRRISLASQTCTSCFKQCSAGLSPTSTLPHCGGKRRGAIFFRAYWSEQSMLVRQHQGKLCLTEGSLLALGRTLQLISERKSSSERFFVVLFCRHKKVPILYD